MEHPFETPGYPGLVETIPILFLDQRHIFFRERPRFKINFVLLTFHFKEGAFQSITSTSVFPTRRTRRPAFLHLFSSSFFPKWKSLENSLESQTTLPEQFRSFLPLISHRLSSKIFVKGPVLASSSFSEL